MWLGAPQSTSRPNLKNERTGRNLVFQLKIMNVTKSSIRQRPINYPVNAFGCTTPPPPPTNSCVDSLEYNYFLRFQMFVNTFRHVSKRGFLNLGHKEARFNTDFNEHRTAMSTPYVEKKNYLNMKHHYYSQLEILN